MNCMSMDSIIEVFYRLNKMLIATKHIVDNNFVLIIIIIIIQHLYSAMVSYAGCRGACGAS